jgi:glycerol-3-phosphate O-acyltransferase/dihydroxyacetone phosphate acyltransferase
MLYPLLRSVSSRALSWFYSRIDVAGIERIPARTPVLLAVNHPNALVDALVVALICPRRIGFTARATLFGNPLLAAFLRAAGVVPLIRQKDVAELGVTSDADRNARAFHAINRALEQRLAILIFPEGVTGDHAGLQPLRTGTARLALQARDAGIRDLAIVPIGLTFERKDAPRTRVFAQVGEPIAVDAWPTGASEDNARTLTAELERRLRAVTLNFESLDAAERDRALAAQLARLFRSSRAVPQVWQPHAPLNDQVAITRRIQETRARIDHLPASESARVAADALLERLARFRDTLGQHGLAIEDLEIDLGVSKGVWFVVREALVATVGIPFAFWGWLNHVIPFRVARGVAMRNVESAADPAMNTVVAGLIAVLLFYLVQTAGVWMVFGGWVALTYLVSLPVAAEVNFRFRDRLARVVQRARAYNRLRANGDLKQQLLTELRTLRADALAVEASLTR